MPVSLVGCAAADLLRLETGAISASALTLHLFVNDMTPDAATRIDDLVEAEGAGYSPIVLDPAGWSYTNGDPARAIYAAQKFTFTAELGQVHGYFLTRANRLARVKRFADGPFVISREGDRIEIAPEFRIGNVVAE